jgi:hypothetical protein
MKKYISPLVFLSLLFFSFSLRAQKEQRSIDDAQFWENFNMDKKLTRNMTARFSHEGRFTNNDSRLTYYFEDVGLEYKFHHHHLAVLADYVFIRKLNVKANVQEYWDTRHQYYVALTWAKKIGELELHDRQMILGQVKDVYSSAAGKIPDYYLRNKFSVKYNFNYYWSVYAAEELYWHLISPAPANFPHVNRMRYFLGGYYKVNDKNEFELYYLFEQHMNIINPNHNYVLGIGYSYSFG